jgi:hypothetical protein
MNAPAHEAHVVANGHERHAQDRTR